MIIGKDRFKVLVIMASYNGELYIENQIDSILNQEQVDVNIFIQDDNSCPRNVKYLEKIKFVNEVFENFFIVSILDFLAVAYKLLTSSLVNTIAS